MIETYLAVGFVLWTFVIAQFDLIHLNKSDIMLSLFFFPICVFAWGIIVMLAVFQEVFKCERI